MDPLFRPLFAFFIIELQSRKVIHVNVTRAPTDLCVAQQLREATPYEQAPNI
jgi:putative transposase